MCDCAMLLSVLRNSVLSWAEFVGDHLLDQSDTVVIVTHSCIARYAYECVLHCTDGAYICIRFLHDACAALRCTVLCWPSSAMDVNTLLFFPQDPGDHLP